ncbi:sugar O-acetyltransferase [Photobacterium sp. GB-50]|uniref:sugar O-acetyltransferase n=1 Tax=Photobacterium sp. GB-50 TaxID=2022107 RepID=UPI000D172ADE|nr:sugar O-acetyltransferase [Photobacterium sp. GB-50]PSW73445.1 sugar O-acetyltransferase [Photobacterium sp. GB-50]
MSSKLSDFSVHLPINPELVQFQQSVKEKLYDFNHARPSEDEKYHRILSELLGSVNGVTILPPFYCDMGKNIHFKRGGFLNAGVKILDIAPVMLGEFVQIGPNVVISTAGHPLDIAERVLPIAAANPITIGDNVWIGAGAIILDGVTIGDRSVIGAGSIVTKDIPADSVAVGNPCRVVKKIEHSAIPSEAELEEMWRQIMEM